MSDLLNSASLVMIPSGYKEDTVYSVVPSDGSGDLSFTRASNGTRVNSAGLVEVCPWNLLQYSEEFDNAYWSKIGVGTGSAPTVTANYGVAPNGTNTADRVVFNTGAGTSSSDRSILRLSGAVLNNNCTGSFYIKSNTGSSQNIGFHNGSQIDVKTVTTSWQRYDTFISSSVSFFGLENLGSNSTAGTCDVLVWGGQLNYGDLKPYFPTTDRLNVPRLTYQNGGGGCPSLLLEKQSTNLVTYSEQFDNAAWNKNNVTITANSVTSPDGTQNADTITDNTTNGSHITYQFGTQTTGTAWTCYMKKGSLNYGYIGAVQSTNLFTTAIINLTNGAIVELQNGSSTTGTVTTEDCGNGWYRVKMQTNANGAGYAIGTSNGAALSGTYKESIYTGTGSGTIYLWGAQLEDSTYATSYIPSTSSSATRVADACFKTGISSLIGQTEGVIFADITPQIFNDSAYQTIAIIYPSGGLGGTYFHFYKNTGSKTLFFEVWNAISQCSLFYTMANNTRYKVAAGYKNNDFVLYVNGVQVGSDTSGTVASVSYSTLEMGYDSFNTDSQMSLSEFVLFPTRLTNAELASLTTI